MTDIPRGGAPPRRLRGPPAFWGGVVLVLVGLFALHASADLPRTAGFPLGPGPAPPKASARP